MRAALFLGILCVALSPALTAQNLKIYFVDVEGGGATLIVAPSGQSMLVDTGNAPPNADRDSTRIDQAMKAAGLSKINFVFTTHYDGDHVGGITATNQYAHFDRFFDHGDVDSRWEQNRGIEERWKAYMSVASGKRTIVKPGDHIPLGAGVDVTVVSAAGKVLSEPINGGAANPYCANAEQKDNKTENSQSAGFLLKYGGFTFVDLGDLTWDKEMALACPVNKLGKVNLFQATHHGFYADMSGAPAHVYGMDPQVVVINDGPHKGLMPPAYEKIAKIPGVEGIWQGHLALGNDKIHNTEEDMIANLEPSDKCRAHLISVSVQPDGKFTVTNARNGFSKSYQARK